MTPLIRELVSVTPESESFMWFDLGRFPSEPVEFMMDPDKLIHLPYKRTAIAGLDSHGDKFMLVAIMGDNHVTVTGISGMGTKHFTQTEPFAYVATDEGLRLLPPDPGEKLPDNKQVMALLSVISRLADATTKTGYQPTAKANSPTNKRRIAKGKLPLSYDWHTVVIEPSPPKTEHQGGTHASPRQHTRRGHWRTVGDKVVWVRDCIVGDASLGSVFKDYKA